MSTSDPQTREEVEAFLCAKLASGEVTTGLYDLGLGYVAVDLVGPEVRFRWFEEAISFDHLLLTN
jgi:hypothetical protein